VKGISHFLAGLAAATFVPGVVEGAAQGSYLIVLGGFFGLLPDTLDFKFARYFEQHVNIDPDPSNLDPQLIATTVAAGSIGPPRPTARSGSSCTTSRSGPIAGGSIASALMRSAAKSSSPSAPS
jgi:hypothetical protein